MLQVVAGRRAAASAAALALFLCQNPAAAQEPDPLDEVNQPLDPSAPLEEWPDLGVGWPDMAEDPGSEIADTPQAGAAADATTARTYSYRIEGLDETESAALLARFRELSTLEEYREQPANAAQVDRRARADAELIAELLRAFGHYDALVRTDVAAGADGAFVVTLNCPASMLLQAPMRRRCARRLQSCPTIRSMRRR